MDKLDISIIILNYNSGNFLTKCLQSIKASDLDGLNIETIIVDNASRDESIELVHKFLSRADSFGKKVKIIRNRKNLGFSAGNNVGVGEASGKYILFLNPDTVLSKTALKQVFEFMEKYPDCGVTTARLELADGTLDEAAHRGFPTPWNAFCYFSGLGKIFPKSRLFSGYTLGWLRDSKENHEVDAISGAFFFIRRAVGEKLSWWDEDFFWYGEDLDFCYRVKKAGWKIMFLPDVKVLHYRGITSGIKGHSKKLSTATRETRLRAARASVEAMRIFYRKHYQKQYPVFITFLVLLAIEVLGRIRIAKTLFS